MKKQYWILSLVPGLCLAGSQALAQAHEITLDPIVVTATKTPKQLENIPAVVTVLSAEDLAAIPARTVGDLLAHLPGVYAYEPQGVGVVTPQSQAISGNGFPGNTLVLLDGQKINTPFTDYAYLTTVPVRAVERIEVIRGPFSALYGSSAGGGIINIITKDGGSGANSVSPWGQVGNFGRHDYGVDLGLNWGNFSLGLFFDHKNVDNYYLYKDQGFDDRNRVYDHNRFHGKLTGSLGSQTTLSLSGGSILGSTGFGLSDQLRLENKQDMEQWYVNAQAHSQINKHWDVKLQLDWLQVVHEYHGETLTGVAPSPFGPPRFRYMPSINDTVSDRYRADLAANYTINPNNILTLGAELVYVTAEKSIYDQQGRLLTVQGRPGVKADESDTIASVYAQYDWIWEEIEVVAGLRYDNYDSYGTEVSPKGSLIWNYGPSGNIKFSVGKGFKAPNLNELYSPPWSIAPFIVYQGNPDLEAETLWSYQFSWEQRLMENQLFTRVTPYITDAKNFITSVRRPDPLNPSGQLMFPDNVREVEIRGVDVELNYMPTPCLNLFASYNYNETRDAQTDRIIDGYPMNSGALGLRGQHRFDAQWNASYSYTARYRGTYTSSSWGAPPVVKNVGDYWFHTARLGLDWQNMISLHVDLFNIFNKRALTDVDRYTPEFNYLAGLSFTYQF